MLTQDLILTASAGLTANKGRALLTMLGVIIGVASVVLMVSVGRSFQNYILTQIEAFGTDTIDVFPSGLEKFGGNLESLTYEDFEAISQLPTVKLAGPIIVVGEKVSYGREEIAPMIMGSDRAFVENYRLKIGTGRGLDDTDEAGAKAVTVLGAQAVEDLFGDAQPLGKRVTIGTQSFTVVGTLEKQGSALSAQLDSFVIVPFSTARALTGQKHLSFVTVRAEGDPNVAAQDITALLRERHNIENPENDPDKDDFVARSAEQVTAIVTSVTMGLTVFLSLIAAISLLVGGIGIMNIMLVSVTERTQEIGLRKAIGAKKRDILLQFLLESVTLTVTGGLIGIVIGISSGWILARIADKVLGEFDFVLSIWAIVLAIIMAVGTGLVFGIYPARKAANLHPIEALRFE
jgi:putative ABC transport system permease protein